EDITTEPGLKNGVEMLAALYDLQWEHPDPQLFDSPTSGDKVARSMQVPETKEDLKTIGVAMKQRTDFSFGMQGRMPDYLNRAMSTFAGSAEVLAEQDPRFADNARSFLVHLRETDLALTHTLISPQINRSVGPSQQSDPFLAARVKEETDAGIVIKGARMLATLPISDEIMVFPSTVLKNTEEDAPYAFGFCIPNDTPGMRFIFRETVDYVRSRDDHPLGARFEEMDAVVVFDDVFVPWERVMMHRDVELCNTAYARSSAVVHMAHQVVCKNISKTEFLLGLVSLMVDAVGIERFQHIQEKVSEIWLNLETMKAFRRVAEVDAEPNEFGVMTPAWDPLDAARNIYPKMYPRMIEIVQQIGASGLVAMPTWVDITGPIADDILKYYQGARVDALDRIPLYRLAWDTALSAFGSRQLHYERYFFGDPVRMASAIFRGKDRSEYMERVAEFLRQTVEEMENETGQTVEA
ncbi:MAG: 4-hydroxyphenylacetate 3-monooxygenase, oxygenase component, partial [Anaerolineae bacterium]